MNADTSREARDRLSAAVAQLDGGWRSSPDSRDAEEDVLAFYSPSPEHWTSCARPNPLERFNREIGRRTDAVGSFPDDQSLIRLAGMLCVKGPLLEKRPDRASVLQHVLGLDSPTARRMGAHVQIGHNQQDGGRLSDPVGRSPIPF